MSLHYNRDKSYLFVNKNEAYKIKIDNENVNFSTQFYLGNTSNGFTSVEFKEVSLTLCQARGPAVCFDPSNMVSTVD